MIEPLEERGVVLSQKRWVGVPRRVQPDNSRESPGIVASSHFKHPPDERERRLAVSDQLIELHFVNRLSLRPLPSLLQQTPHQLPPLIRCNRRPFARKANDLPFELLSPLHFQTNLGHVHTKKLKLRIPDRPHQI